MIKATRDFRDLVSEAKNASIGGQLDREGRAGLMRRAKAMGLTEDQAITILAAEQRPRLPVTSIGE